MTTPPIPPMYRDLDFNGPLNDDRAARLIRSLGSLKHQHITDVGCGWADRVELVTKDVGTWKGGLRKTPEPALSPQRPRTARS